MDDEEEKRFSGGWEEDEGKWRFLAGVGKEVRPGLKPITWENPGGDPAGVSHVGPCHGNSYESEQKLAQNASWTNPTERPARLLEAIFPGLDDTNSMSFVSTTPSGKLSARRGQREGAARLAQNESWNQRPARPGEGICPALREAVGGAQPTQSPKRQP